MLPRSNGILSKISRFRTIFGGHLRGDTRANVHLVSLNNCNRVYGSMSSSETIRTSFANSNDNNNNNNNNGNDNNNNNNNNNDNDNNNNNNNNNDNDNNNNAKNKTSQYGTLYNQKLSANPTSNGQTLKWPAQQNRRRPQSQLSCRSSRLRYSSHEKSPTFPNQTRQMRSVSSNQRPRHKGHRCLSRSPNAGDHRRKYSLPFNACPIKRRDNMTHKDASPCARFRPSTENSTGTCGFQALNAENKANNVYCQQESANNPNGQSNNMNPTGPDKGETFHLRQVIRINPDSGEVEVQPAVVVGTSTGQVIDQRTHILGDQNQYLLQEDFSKNFRTVSPAGGTQKFFKAPIPNTQGSTRLEYRFQSNPTQGEQTHVTMTADGRTQQIPETNQLDKDFSKLTRRNQQNKHNAVAGMKPAESSALSRNGNCSSDSVSCVNNSSDTIHKHDGMDVREQHYDDAISHSDITIEQTIIIDPRNYIDNVEVPPTKPILANPGIFESRKSSLPSIPILNADNEQNYVHLGDDEMLPPPPLAPVKSVSFNYDVFDPMPSGNQLKKEASENADWHRMALSGNLVEKDDQLELQTDENDTDFVEIADSEPA